MNASSESSEGERATSTVARGVGWLAGLGGVIGGVAATFDWPVVGTFFGAVEGALAGALVGALDAVALTLLARCTRSRSAARALSGLVAGTGAAWAARLYTGPISAAPLLTAALVAAGMVLGAALGPLIASGVDPGTGERPSGPWLLRVGGRLLAVGSALGAVAGAIAGLVLGIRAYLPTFPAATVEGAVLGAVSGCVLAGLAAGVVVLPRLRARR